jgi:phosphopentomutase
MVNLVDFDMLYGHRNNPRGYADSLLAFDRRLPELEAAMGPDEVLILTADHGNDPTTEGTDHTREYVPLLIKGTGQWNARFAARNLGHRSSFADLGATVADLLALDPWPEGKSLMAE